MIFAGKVQTLSMETEDLQTVEHVEQNIWLLKLGHFLNREDMHDSSDRNPSLINSFLLPGELRQTAEYCDIRKPHLCFRKPLSCASATSA